MGLMPQDLTYLKKKAPWLFQTSMAQIRSVRGFLNELLMSSGETSDVKRQSILGNLLKSYPTIFQLSVDNSLKPKVAFLETSCALTEKDVFSLLKGSRAAFFTLSIEDNLQPTLEILKGLMPPSRSNGTDQERRFIRDIIMKHPQILCLSHSNLREKIAYFDSIDALDQKYLSNSESLASRIAVRSPVIFSLSLKENIKPKIAFLAKVWGLKAPGEDHDVNASTCHDEGDNSLSGLLGEYPSILTLSLQGNIQPTLNFYNQTGFIQFDSNWNRRPNHQVHMIVASDGLSVVSPQLPVIRARFIAASLFHRLLPRWHFYLKTKLARDMNMALKETVKDDNTLHGNTTTNLPSLHILAVASDKKYCEYLKVETKEYTAFKVDTIPRLKFSSQFDTWLKTGIPIDV